MQGTSGQWRRTALAACAAWTLSGCSSSGTLSVATPVAAPRRFDTALVDVTSPLGSGWVEAWQIEETTATLARRRHVFDTVLSRRAAPDARADLIIQGQLVELRGVSAEQRSDGGLVGKARVVVDVTLRDGTTNAVVARFVVDGRSSTNGATEQAVLRAAEQTVAFLATQVQMPRAGTPRATRGR